MFHHYTYLLSPHPPRIPFHLIFYHFFPSLSTCLRHFRKFPTAFKPFVYIYIYVYRYLSICLSQVGAQGVLVRDGSSQSDGNHSVLVKALFENGLLSSKRTQFWFSRCTKKVSKASIRMWFCLMLRAQLAQILIVSDLVVLVIAPENDAQQAPKEASRGLQELQSPRQKRLAASRGFHEPPGGEP